MVTEQKLYGILADSTTFSIAVGSVRERKQYPNIVPETPPGHVMSGMWALLTP